MPRHGQSGAVQRSGSVNRRFDRLLLVAKTILSLPKPVEDAILGSKSPGIWRMLDKVLEAIAKGCLH